MKDSLGVSRFKWAHARVKLEILVYINTVPVAYLILNEIVKSHLLQNVVHI